MLIYNIFNHNLKHLNYNNFYTFIVNYIFQYLTTYPQLAPQWKNPGYGPVHFNAYLLHILINFMAYFKTYNAYFCLALLISIRRMSQNKAECLNISDIKKSFINVKY